MQTTSYEFTVKIRHVFLNKESFQFVENSKFIVIFIAAETLKIYLTITSKFNGEFMLNSKVAEPEEIEIAKNSIINELKKKKPKNIIEFLRERFSESLKTENVNQLINNKKTKHVKSIRAFQSKQKLNKLSSLNEYEKRLEKVVQFQNELKQKNIQKSIFLKENYQIKCNILQISTAIKDTIQNRSRFPVSWTFIIKLFTFMRKLKITFRQKRICFRKKSKNIKTIQATFCHISKILKQTSFKKTQYDSSIFHLYPVINFSIARSHIFEKAKSNIKHIFSIWLMKEKIKAKKISYQSKSKVIRNIFVLSD